MSAAAVLAEAHAHPEGPPLIEAISMTKAFGGNTVLDQASLTLEPGTLHALLGENGAGKSTLVKCMMGFYQADSGDLCVNGKAVQVGSPRDAQALGIGMVYQHFTLVENMTVAENLLIARRELPRIIDFKKEIAALNAFMDKMPFRIDPTRQVRTLAAGEKQKLEILKQLYLGSRVMILDEPTSVLTPDEADEVLGLVKQMATRRELSVLMITHKFREVLAFADHVTILRRGKLVASAPVKELTPEKMAELMVGAEPPSQSSARKEQAPGDTVLDVSGIEADDDIGLPVLEGVTLTVCAGEIVGIAGVSGNGQDELVEVLAGQRPSRGGSVRVSGSAYGATRAQIFTRKVRLLPEAPLKNACVANMSVADNVAFREYDRPPFTLAGFVLRLNAFRKRAEEAIRSFRIRTPSPAAPIGTLSGGNVQRAVLSRELSGDVSVLIAANPCFGLDFGAVAEIRSRIMDARNKGAAVLLISADLEEIFALSDRILVMSEGKIVHETPAKSADLREIGRHMAGHALKRLVARLAELAGRAAGWETLRDGVEIWKLAGDGNSGATVALLRYQPGARIPPHRHPGFEVIYVIAGSQRDDTGTYAAGSLVVNPPGHQHGVASDEGCTVLIVWERPVEFLADGAQE